MEQKAIILAAGRGSRMQGLCKNLPKPMLEVNGKPILSHTIDGLLENGIQRIGINIHHQHLVIKNFIKEKYADHHIELIYEDQLTGTAGALRNFHDFLSDQEQFLVLAGDILTDYPFKKLIDFHRQSNAMASFVYHERKKSNSYLELDEQQRVITFIERPNKTIFDNQTTSKVNSSIYCFNQQILKMIPPEGIIDIPRDIFPSVLSKKKLYATPLEGQRWAIDTPQRLSQAREEFK